MLWYLTIFVFVLSGCKVSNEEPERVGAPPIFWSDEPLSIPPESSIQSELHKAHDLRLRENFEEVLDAHDPGELIEHATLTQISLDRGVFDNDDVFVFGDELFDYKFRPENGWGDNLAGQGPTIHRAHRGNMGGPDSFSCSGCHSKGGLDGAGSITQNAYFSSDGNQIGSAIERNPPHLLGLGPIEALAAEMTRSLRAQRAEAVRTATETMTRTEALLSAKGVEFGRIYVLPNGEIDPTYIKGVDRDLVVRPFGWKGRHATIRENVEFSFRIHLGIVSASLQQKIHDGLLAGEDYGDGPWYDVDQDGVSVEIEDGMLISVAVYLAQLAVPIIRPPTHSTLLGFYERGRILFANAKCDVCHIPQLQLVDPRIEFRPMHPDYRDSPKLVVNVAVDGEPPKISLSESGPFYRVELYSDLKRHDMGPDLASKSLDGDIPDQEFLTRPLWGLSESSPFLHDGRAQTLHDAILSHGGEAEESRDAYLSLKPDEQRMLQVFLLSLSRTPVLEVQ